MSIQGGRPRGRTPGRSPMRPRVSCGQEPPKDLLELRRTHPGVRWGGNVPEKRRYEEEMMPAMDPNVSSLPAAYLEATRGNGYGGRESGTYSRPTAPTSGRRSNSAATSRRRGSLTSNGLASFGAKTPWKSGPSRWDKGQASSMAGLFSAPTANSERRGRRTRSPVQAAGGVNSRPSTPTPSNRKVFACTSSKPVIPGFSPFQCTAAMPERKVTRASSGKRTPRRERGVYSTAPTRRTPSPRPYATRSDLRTSSPKTIAPPDHSDKMIAALADRTHQLNVTAAMGDQLFDSVDQSGILPQRHPLQHQQLMQSIAEQSATTAPELFFF
eukprot:TRINITY_DN17301_c1_g2_i2.p1 TRINITY_DN17301_c1_g2~~TRINITY_DN17301_c1_g2_i2.p1  ORF type:complete len:327 (+),score=53.95 TRINITY_DN17301_c1_g2_i2:55-1035(+)